MRTLLPTACCAGLFLLSACGGTSSSSTTPAQQATSPVQTNENVEFVSGAVSAPTSEYTTSQANTCVLENPDLAKDEQLTDALINEIKRQTGAVISRVLLPHQAVTLEYNAARVNILIDNEMHVVRIYCG